MDAIYTPPDLADELVSASRLTAPKIIADFAAGDGALLRAAAKTFPRAKLLGADIDPEAIDLLPRTLASCETEVHDFFSDIPANFQRRRFDLILLNPPFSCRGNEKHTINLDGIEYKASRALAFVARATKFLKRNGELLAIIPSSVFFSERDEDALHALRSIGELEQIGEVRRSAFEGHSVSISMLRFRATRQAPRIGNGRPEAKNLRPFAVEITRGWVSVHKAENTKNGCRFIHTTDLRDEQLKDMVVRVSPRYRTISGPAILIPRVGRPSVSKVVLIGEEKVVLSDCVIALRTTPPGSEVELAREIKRNWLTFQQIYGGSCAPYTTIRRIREMLLELGVLTALPSGNGPQYEKQRCDQTDMPSNETSLQDTRMPSQI